MCFMMFHDSRVSLHGIFGMLYCWYIVHTIGYHHGSIFYHKYINLQKIDALGVIINFYGDRGTVWITIFSQCKFACLCVSFLPKLISYKNYSWLLIRGKLFKTTTWKSCFCASKHHQVPTQGCHIVEELRGGSSLAWGKNMSQIGALKPGPGKIVGYKIS